MFVSGHCFLGDEDVMLRNSYSTTVTQISQAAEWLEISREDFLQKFLFTDYYKNLFMEMATAKIDDYA